MATGATTETKECIFQWKLENISQCLCLLEVKKLQSPTFISNIMAGTKWSLWLYPLGNNDENKNYVGFYLSREKDCCGPNSIEVKFQLAFLGQDGTLLTEKTVCKRSFMRGAVWGFPKYETVEKVFADRKKFLREDVLTVQCTVWNTNGKSVKTSYLYSRMVFRTYRRSFAWRVDKFSSVQHDSRKKLKVGFIDFDLVSNDKPSDFDRKIIIDINSFADRMIYFSFKTSIFDSDRRKHNCGMKEYFVSDIKKKVLSFTMVFPKWLMEHKNSYLPNDVLALECEYVYSTVTNQRDFIDREIVSETKNIQIEKKCEVPKEKLLNTSVLIDDFKSLYKNGIFSDVKLSTSTHTFPAHKAILSARSAVFRKMFSCDMKEKNSGYVEINDLEDDTIHKILLYMYTDSVEDLQFESACKLYAAADKYQIKSLRSKCSSFLKANICPTRACDVLILADLYQDEDLKCATEAYVLEHDEVLSSLEWKYFMDSNVKLAADVMYRKIYKGKVYRSDQNRWCFPRALLAKLWPSIIW